MLLACDHALSLHLCNLFLGGGRYFFPSRAKEGKKQKKKTPDLRFEYASDQAVEL